jgi:hypothetical protein
LLPPCRLSTFVLSFFFFFFFNFDILPRISIHTKSPLENLTRNDVFECF